MGFSTDKNTLARYDARALTTRRDMRWWPLSSFISAMKVFKGTNASVTPQVQALDFYLMNHAVSEVRRRVSRSERLDKYRFILDDYHEGASEMAMRVFYYILYITVREARHYKGSFHDEVYFGGYDEDVRAFFAGLQGTEPGTVLNKLLNEPPPARIGVIADLLDDVFNKCPWQTGSVGGKRWGQIALCLKKVVAGEHSMETMLDEAWALEHNGGAMFNKDFLFKTQDKAILLTVLDVQRAGMIPQFAASGFAKNIVTPRIATKYGSYHEVLGECFAGDVDWKYVTEVGAGTYSHLISAPLPTTPGPWPAGTNASTKPKVLPGGSSLPKTPTKPPHDPAYATGAEVYIDGNLSVKKLYKGRKVGG